MQKTNFKTIKQNSFSKVIEEDVFYWKAKKLMKRVGNLLEQIISIENLNEAVDAFLDTKNKTKRSIKRVAENREKIINELIEDIKNETFKPSKFNEFTVKEGKKVRLIQSLPYYDRIALNAIMRVCGEVLYITSNTVSVKIDASGEAFLTVGTGGLKLSGVQTAINTAVATEKNRAEGIENSLRTDVDSKVSGITTSDTSITVDNTTTTNPKLKVTLSQTDGNRLALNADGLYVTNTIDCGTF